jgi:hypothetical protein
MTAAIADRGYKIVGTLDDLVATVGPTPPEPTTPLPESAIVEVGVGVVDALLRRISQEQQGGTAGSDAEQKRTLLSRIRHRAVATGPTDGGGPTKSDVRKPT